MSKQDTSVPVIVQTHVDKKSMGLAIGIAAVALICALFTMVSVLQKPKPPVIISVSIKSLLEEHMVTTIGQNISQAEAELRTSEYIASIEGAIEELTGDETVIVVASEAVLGSNVPDFTGDIRLMARERAEFLAQRRGAVLPPLGDRMSMNQVFDKLVADTANLQTQLDALDPALAPGRSGQ